MVKELYHTQEARGESLLNPIKCVRDDAWLGEGYYFWYDMNDAYEWGHNSKKATGYFEVYKSEIDYDNVLDTVFNEEHYIFWKDQINKVAKKIVKATNKKPSIKELNDYFKERGAWNELTGIQFQDLPANNNHLLVEPIQYRNKKVAFAYIKRIQLVVYSSKIISTFALLTRKECINV